MIYLLYTVHIVVCIFLILVVLLQQGKGADLSVFGGGSTQTVFGARGAATLLHKMTVIGFIAFTLTTISIGFFQGGDRGSVFAGARAEEAETAPSPESAEPPVEPAEPPASGAADQPAAAGEGAAEAPEGAADGGTADDGNDGGS